MFGQVDQTDDLAVSLGRRHTEVAEHFFFGVASLVLRDRNDPASAELCKAADDRMIVAKMPIAVQLVKNDRARPDSPSRAGASGAGPC